MFAGNRSTVAYSVFGTGELDIASLTIAFHTLRVRYPVLSARIVPDGNGYTLEHGSRTPALRVGTCTSLPTGGFTVVDPDTVCAVDVAQQENSFRLTLLTHHSVADAAASLRYLEALCAFYTRVVETGSPGEVRPHPFAVSLEQFLDARGFDIPEPLDTVPPATDSDAAAAATVRHGRTRLGAEETARLFGAGRQAGLTVHGIVCAAIVLAAHDLSRSDGRVSFSVVSSVDLRTRVGAPIAAADGTVIQGSDTAAVAIRPHDEPTRVGRAVLDSLADGLSHRTVHQAFLRPQAIWRQPATNPLMVTNWGRIPPLLFPKGVWVNDFRASASGLRTGTVASAPPSFFITTCDGRLSLDHPAWVSDGSDPTALWTAALRRAFDRILD